jgi:flagellar biogenesis protein FliO
MKTLRFAASTLASMHPKPFQVPTAASSQAPLQGSVGLLSTLWRWIQARQIGKSNTKRLQVTSSVSLGEKRFVAVVQVDGQQFLVGGGATGVSLLAQLEKKESFGEVLQETATAPEKKPVKRASKQMVTQADKPRTKRAGNQAWWSTL